MTKKSLMSMALATTLAFTTLSPAYAQEATEPVANPVVENTVNDHDVTSGEEEDAEEATGLTTVHKALIGVASALGLSGLLAAGVNWAIQTRMIPNPLPGIIPGPPAPPAPAPAPPAPPAPAPAPPAPPAPAPVRAVAPAPAPAPAPSVYYRNCRQVWNELGRPIRRNDRGYASHLDRDGDGIGCERRPR